MPQALNYITQYVEWTTSSRKKSMQKPFKKDSFGWKRIPFSFSCRVLCFFWGSRERNIAWNNSFDTSWQKTHCYGYAPYTTSIVHQYPTWPRPPAKRMSHVIPVKNLWKKPWICWNLPVFYQRLVFPQIWVQKYLFVRIRKEKKNECSTIFHKIQLRASDVARLRIIFEWSFCRRTTSSSWNGIRWVIFVVY